MNSRSRVVALVIAILVICGFLWWNRSSTPTTPPPAAVAALVPPDRIDVRDTIIRPGDVVTSQGLDTTYYVGLNNKRYVFTTEQTYITWYPRATPVKLLDRKVLKSIPLANNVTYRPGMRIITFDTDPSHYVVAHGGVLRKASDSILRQYYGSTWRDRIDTLPEYYRADYKLGAPVNSARDYSPTDEYNSNPTISIDKGLTTNLPMRK